MTFLTSHIAYTNKNPDSSRVGVPLSNQKGVLKKVFLEVCLLDSVFSLWFNHIIVININ